MNTPVRLGIVFVVALVIQLTVFVDVRIFGVAPELLALVAVVAAFFVGPERGPVIAFVAGLLWDVYLPTPSVSRRSSSPWLRLSSPRSMRDCSTTLGPSLSVWSPSAVPPA